MQNRRSVLLSIGTGTAVMLTGCTGSTDDNDGAINPTSTPNPAPNNTPEPTRTPTETPIEPAATVTNSRVFQAPMLSDGDGQTVPWMHATVENPTGEHHRYVRVKSTFRGTDGDVIGTWEQYTAVFPPGTTWHYYARQDFDYESFDAVEHRVAEQEVGIRGQVLPNADVLNASMSHENQFVDITGEVDPGDLQNDSVEIIGLIYDEDDRFRGSVRSRETSPGDTVTFDDGFTGFRTPNGEPVPSSFDLLIVDGYV